MATKYDAKSIRSIKDDRSRVREKPTLYIPSTYADGAAHIIFEVIDNSIDELAIKDPVGTNLSVTFDIGTREVVVIDDGRGIPHASLLDVCTVLNTSGKFDNSETSAYVVAGGIHGCGEKTAVYLSKYCEVTSIREGKSLTYKFVDGILKDTINIRAKGHGVITKFKIDQKLVDVNGVDPAIIKERLQQKSYCFPDINMVYTVLDKGKEVKSYTFGGRTIVDLVKGWKPDTEVIEIHGSRKQRILKEIDDAEISTIKVEVDVALAMKEAALDTDTDKYIVSYANAILTYDGGTHMEGFKLGLIKFYREVLAQRGNKRDKELNVTPNDITSGLCGVVSIRVPKPEFSAQHKARLNNQEVKFAVRDVVFDALCEEKPAVTNTIGDFIRRVARGRMASKKVRKKDTENAFSDDRPAKYEPLVYNMKTTRKSLILVEGDSVSGLVVAARDPYNQAVYTIRKPKNVYDSDSESIMNATVNNFNEVMKICNIEPGPKCDPEKCAFDEIWLLPDGDVDGDGICVTMAGLFARHCKPLIDAGMVGRIIPPLYSYRDGKKKKFVQSKRKFFKLIMDRFLADAEVKFNGKVMPKKELMAFLELNMDYDTRLNKLADYYCTDPHLLEHVVWKYHGRTVDQKKSYWLAAMKPYKDLSVLVENGQVVIDGDMPGSDYVNLAFDDHFDIRMRQFKSTQSKNRKIDGYEINNKSGTIYDVMTALRKYMPPDVKYYKGLGELEVKEMAELCLDPDKRTGIIFKFKDYEEDMRKLSIILSNRKEFSDLRMEVISKCRLSDEDLCT